MQHAFVGSWRDIYHTNVLTTGIEAVQGNLREHFVPEMYIKEREIRKIELGLKDTEEIRTLFKKE
jgi:hypothetical protein